MEFYRPLSLGFRETHIRVLWSPYLKELGLLHLHMCRPLKSTPSKLTLLSPDNLVLLNKRSLTNVHLHMYGRCNHIPSGLYLDHLSCSADAYTCHFPITTHGHEQGRVRPTTIF